MTHDVMNVVLAGLAALALTIILYCLEDLLFMTWPGPGNETPALPQNSSPEACPQGPSAPQKRLDAELCGVQRPEQRPLPIAMKSIPLLLAVAGLALVAAGCAFNRPLLTERVSVITNGVVTVVSERSLRITSLALWPATQQIEKQRASLGKTLGVGMVNVDQDSGGTNVVAALQAIEGIVRQIH